MLLLMPRLIPQSTSQFQLKTSFLRRKRRRLPSPPQRKRLKISFPQNSWEIWEPQLEEPVTSSHQNSWETWEHQPPEVRVTSFLQNLWEIWAPSPWPKNSTGVNTTDSEFRATLSGIDELLSQSIIFKLKVFNIIIIKPCY
jgi:hypothetical protein